VSKKHYQRWRIIELVVQVSDFEDMRLLIQLARLLRGFCSSGQRFACGFLRFHLAIDTLAVQLTIPLSG
jgi:hypothetical protein